MTRIDRDMQVGEVLWILGVREVKDYDAFMKDIFKKVKKYDKGERVWVPRGYYSTSKIKDDDILMMILEAEV